ncbi:MULTISPECIES: hydroxymethylglutaryl-CoA synthase [Ligilactobacillus]|uniref:Hydroxymethylglutaryl-CoA synthase n=3 Tax=Ligilactobacillus salivarius TaxID=1624 RepID=F7QW15_9LACO|nr:MULTISPECIES: hydroxymethylglutaryl-CoA synthase [Ligilactobacillus]AYC11392.1 Hydroxymethylglutaryl-CoA synthase [Ligilactobacillus salivarius]EGL99211.1 hydroxymethylglutaryl-CoA synthase [Ligilactobacillus salivarius NIAS840]EGM50805.1 Hydroxymethylglutaryl-CoA synthase [Ligilactobacillus salivarius GJ-24]MBD5789403.1 hydroxymethylglutaryl-CoA synthase [Ligilactobacillus salivarius]MBE5066182.1 hydroxymethylglutaryl-CoA synthase [Ligilactobacillus salivarius]
MDIGIDKINFFTSNLYVDMTELAITRNEDPDKYLIGIGQSKMAVIPPTQDIVTMGANAAESMLTDEDKEDIDLVIVGTESGIDNSKSAAAYIADLLGLRDDIRTFEIKQACYGATAALQMAKAQVALNPDSKALIIGADIAKYGLNTPGEVTQGGGAVAMLVSANPKLLSFEGGSTYLSRNIMDFWRPLGHSEALVDGKYSSNVYLDFFNNVYSNYKDKTGFTIDNFEALLFHLPYTKMGLKALREAQKDADAKVSAKLTHRFEDSRLYNRQVGNLYTGSLYLSLLSLLENNDDLKSGDRLGLFSYGSGAQGEFFAMLLRKDYRKYLMNTTNEFLQKRTRISVEEYEKIYLRSLHYENNSELDLDMDDAQFVLTGIKENQRQYKNRI